MSKRLRVYFNEFNVSLGKYSYLPLVSGILRAYAETDPLIRDRYEFAPFLYKMDSVANVLSQYDDPDVAAFSVSMWNEQLCLKAVQEVKRRWPKCLTIFGGCHVPHLPILYMMQYPFIDVCVRAEGEEAFREILSRYDGSGHDFDGILDVTYWNQRKAYSPVSTPGKRPFVKDLDRYPSPYLTGMYDQLMRDHPDSWQAIIETNRGCPFDCSFCYWAQGGLALKYKFHSLDYVKDEITWMGRNNIPYLFGADSNFAMHNRDREIAEHVVKTKRDYGSPEKFRVCFGKNTDEKIFEVAGILHDAGLEKGITLARQSNDETALKNIRRDNIKLSTYRNLQMRFNDKDIPVYSELILGLPGETVESWKRGIDELLTSGLRNQLFVYLCQVLPNTELADPAYREKHGIKTRRVKLTEIHGSVRDAGWVDEFEEIVIATDSMPHDDWREMCKFSWLTMLLHSMKAGFFVLGWLWDRYQIPPSEFISFLLQQQKPESPLGLLFTQWECLLDLMMLGEGRGTILKDYGDIYWDVEEAALLQCAEDWNAFYSDLSKRLLEFLVDREDKPDCGELADVIIYQWMRMPSFSATIPGITTSLNVAEYFDKLFGSSPVQLQSKWQTMILKLKTFPDRESFARETVLWGRKSGTMLVPCQWEDV